MWGLGTSPILFPQVAGHFPPATTLFGPTELALMKAMLDETDDDDQARQAAGMAATIQRLKLEDSINAKMELYAINKLKGVLSAQAEQYDADFPADAPHAVLLGPQFPRDMREIPIQGKIASISVSGVVDDRGLFADPYWSTVQPADRLTGHTFHLLSGVRSGDDISIIDHRLKGAGSPSIMLEETTGLAPGDSFKILDITLPQDNLTKKDRSTDWAISTAIRDTFDGTNTSPVIRSAYWTANGNLKGRDLISAGVPYRITAHNLGASITLEGAPVLAGAFSIMAKSPFETGIQKTHSLHSDDGTVYGHIEPNTRLRLTPRNLGGNSGKDQIKDSQAMIDRYLHFRFQKYFGSLIRLNRFRKTAKLINQQWDQKLLRREDIQTVTTDLNLPLEAFGQ